MVSVKSQVQILALAPTILAMRREERRETREERREKGEKRGERGIFYLLNLSAIIYKVGIIISVELPR